MFQTLTSRDRCISQSEKSKNTSTICMNTCSSKSDLLAFSVGARQAKAIMKDSSICNSGAISRSYLWCSYNSYIRASYSNENELISPSTLIFIFSYCEKPQIEDLRSASRVSPDLFISHALHVHKTRSNSSYLWKLCSGSSPEMLLLNFNCITSRYFRLLDFIRASAKQSLSHILFVCTKLGDKLFFLIYGP